MSRKNGSPNYLAFEYDKEVTVTLAEDRGRLSSNDYGEFFARNFADGRFTCASPDLERRLIDSGARRGSVVSITKEKYGRSALWVVKLLGSNMLKEPAKPATVKANGNGHTNGHAAAIDHAWNDLPAEKYAPAPNGNGSTPHTLEDQLKASIAAVQAVEELREPKNLLERAAQAAVDCAIFAESYAAKQGKLLQIPADSICAWASTLFINARNGGSR